MYYPPAKFDMSSDCCVSADTHTRMYKAAKHPTHAGHYVGDSNNPSEVYGHTAFAMFRESTIINNYSRQGVF